MMHHDQKIIFVKEICERKTVLFGYFSASLTKREKEEAWIDIVAVCRNQYGFNPAPEGKDWRYVRDKVWGNLKANTLVS